MSQPGYSDIIAAERQRGSTLFLTTIAVFPESTRPSLSPRSMYSRDLDLCPSVCYDVVFPGGLIQLRLLKQGVGHPRVFVLFCAKFPSIWS